MLRCLVKSTEPLRKYPRSRIKCYSMTSIHLPPRYEPNPDEVFAAVDAAPEGNPRRAELLGDAARPVVVEGHLEKP
jgi:hypothetical protein